MQITKAMELVATSKLRRAKLKAEATRPFDEVLSESLESLLLCDEINSSEWSRVSEKPKTIIIVIAGDRGLAGGYNSNIFRLSSSLRSENDIFLPIGKKALEYFSHRGESIYSSLFGEVAEVSVSDTFDIAESVCKSFRSGEIDRVLLVYTRFDSMMTQTAVYRELLPLPRPKVQRRYDPLFEGESEEILEKVIATFVSGSIHSAVCESLASESGARRAAMNAANKNAEEMIGALMLSYNRARQAIITQEITEIVSGAEAL